MNSHTLVYKTSALTTELWREACWLGFSNVCTLESKYDQLLGKMSLHHFLATQTHVAYFYTSHLGINTWHIKICLHTSHRLVRHVWLIYGRPLLNSNKNKCSAKIWTRVSGFRVQRANHYTTEPFYIKVKTIALCSHNYNEKTKNQFFGITESFFRVFLTLYSQIGI